MPKSKKKKNADFQKVKLKVGKRLPKGSNETNLAFKSRTVKVTQTLKDHSKPGSQPQTKRKLTLEELLKQCNSNKTCSQRLTAVEGVKELLLSETGQDVVISCLSKVMEKVSTLLSDTEPTVRQAVLRLCKTIFSLISSEKHSFFDYMSAHLCCAMNNISDHVRQDALSLFDMLLEKFPHQVTGAYSNLVPTLIGQISSHMMTPSKTVTLMCNPNSKLSSQQWRAAVLQRLKSIVETVVKKHHMEESLVDDEAEVFESGDQFPISRGPTVRPCVRKMWIDPYMSKYEQQLNATRQEFADLTRSRDCLEKFVSSLLPLIRQCWIEEFCSEGSTVVLQADSRREQQLSEKSLPMVKCLVGLLHAFVDCWRCVDSSDTKSTKENPWFCGEFHQFLRELLLPKFPIYVMEKTKMHSKGKPAKQTVLQVSLLKLNLEICEIIAGVGKPGGSFNTEDCHKKVLNFLLKNLKLCGKAELAKQVTSVLQKVFLNFPPNKRVAKLLLKAQKCFIKAHPLSAEKRAYLDLFDLLAFDPNLESPYHTRHHDRHSKLTPYFDSLPGLLLLLKTLENSDALACHVTKCMSHTGSWQLTTAMTQHMEQLLDDTSGVFAILPQKCHGSLAMAVTWTYHKQPAPENILELVELVCRLPQVSAETSDRLVSGLHAKYEALFRKKQHCESMNDYLRFFLTILVGHKRVELESFHDNHSKEAGGLTCILWNASGHQMEKHAYVVKRCVSNFSPYLDSSTHLYGTQTLQIMADTWTSKILTKYNAVSVFTAYSALTHWIRMVSPLQNYGDFIDLDDPLSPRLGSQDDLSTKQCHMEELLQALKLRMRPFTKLVFSVLYSIVSMETAEIEMDVDKAVVEMMMGVALKVATQSLRVLLDLCMVAVDFVQNTKEMCIMKAVIVMTKLLGSRELTDMLSQYQPAIKHHIALFTQAIKEISSNINEMSWWQDFLKVTA